MECFWSDPSKHPQCPHGPTLLFGSYNDGKLEKSYLCAACRERRLCKFQLKEGEQLTKQQTAKWQQLKKQYASRYHQISLYLTLNKITGLAPENRCYCHTCERLISKVELNATDKHKDHSIQEGLTDYQLRHPTEILKPLENNKQEAQYFFTKKSTEDIMNMLVKLGAKQVLCIGTPKIHEDILENHEEKISSLLLDFDGRFHNFFGPLNYCWYNLLNNHFFNESSAQVFKDFLTQNGGKDTYLVCDPPFGSRIEPISWTIKKISELHSKWNNIENEKDCLKTMFIFPYFMEGIIKQKSNPPGVSGGLKHFKMTDYKVSYDNHSLFVTDPKTKTKKVPSPIRIYTNIPLHLLEFPESDGYKYCKKCQKWVSEENKHCKKCQECTSKNGLTYKHCRICNRCVKPYWKHCKTCKRCIMTKHVCGQKPQINGNCFKCNEFGHTEKECKVDQENRANVEKTKNIKKRKANNEKETISDVKRRKLDDSSKPGKGERKITPKAIKAPIKKLKIEGKKQKITQGIKIKTLNKKQSKKRNKEKLQPQSNGVKSIKKKTKKGKT